VSVGYSARGMPAPLIATVGKTVVRTVSLPVPVAGSQNPILRMNALPVVGLPTKALSLKFGATREWVDLREAERRVKGRILCTREADVWAWGHEAQLREAFGADLKGIADADLTDRVADFGSNLYLKRFLEMVSRVLSGTANRSSSADFVAMRS